MLIRTTFKPLGISNDEIKNRYASEANLFKVALQKASSSVPSSSQRKKINCNIIQVQFVLIVFFISLAYVTSYTYIIIQPCTYVIAQAWMENNFPTR
jgi:hypothetical protein